MKKTGFRTLILLIALFVTVWIGGRFDNIDKANSNDPNIIRVAAANRFDSLDILFIGSSACYSGINPYYFDSIGLDTYNLGIAAAGPYFYELLLNDYLRSVIVKPKSVYIILSPSTFMREIDDFTSFGIHRYLNQPLSNEKIAQQYSGWLSYPALFLKSFQKGTKNIISTRKVSMEVAQRTISDKGFYRSDEVTSSAKEVVEKLSYQKWKSEELDTIKVNYLDNYLASIKQQGMEVVLLSLPSNKLLSLFNNTYLLKYDEAMTALAKKYIFLDLSHKQLDSTCYRNSDHLNTKGATVVTQTLIKKIQSDKQLSERLSFHFN